MKALFTPSLLTGDEMIDAHHKELFKRANDLFESIENGDSTEKVQETLGFLADYTTYHFSEEEKLMDEVQYPKTDAHKEMHAALVEDVKNLAVKLAAEGPTKEFEEQVNKKVIEWLYTHIKVNDQELAEYKNVRSQMDNLQ